MRRKGQGNMANIQQAAGSTECQAPVMAIVPHLRAEEMCSAGRSHCSGSQGCQAGMPRPKPSSHPTGGSGPLHQCGIPGVLGGRRHCPLGNVWRQGSHRLRGAQASSNSWGNGDFSCSPEGLRKVLRDSAWDSRRVPLGNAISGPPSYALWSTHPL